MLTPAEATSEFSEFKVFSCRPSVSDLIPARPGVYAFYRKLSFSPKDPTRTLNWLVGSINRKPHCEFDLPRRITVDLLSRPANLEHSTAGKLEIQDKDYLGDLARTLFAFSIFTRPWYVGSTSNLRRRFREHLDTGFVQFMEEDPSGLDREDFLFLAYPTRASLTDDLESLFIQLGNPLFNMQRR